MQHLTTEQREDVVYNVLENMITTRQLRTNQIVNNKDSNTHVALIVEPRRHRFLEHVIRNVMYFVNMNENYDWNLHVVTSEETKKWLCSIFPEWNFRISVLSVDNLTQQMYNDMFMSAAFWENIVEENILVFQTDVLMFRDNIADFTSFDFIGANFFDPNDISLYHGGNNGGFSFRHKSAMLQCIRDVSPIKVEQYLASHGKHIKPCLMEDVYFTSACEILGKKMSTVEERKKFSVEDCTKEFYLEPLGCHRFASPQLCHVLLTIISHSKW